MVKHLLPQVPRYFKANLHTHSTFSDGKMTPKECKDLYKSKGYSILALTDHNIVADHSNLNDANFLMLTGAEYNFDAPNLPYAHLKTYHLNFIAKRPDLLWQPFISTTHKHFEDVSDHLAKAEIEGMPQVYDTDVINAIIARANEKGHFVTYNHPAWSLQDYTDYAPLKGLWGMELCNTSCMLGGLEDDEHCSMVYRDLMNLTGRIFPVCADDAHGPSSACGAWIMIGAKELEYSSVIEAMERGDFYASNGPEIHYLTWDGEFLEINCSDAKDITVLSNGRFWRRVRPAEGEATVQHAKIDMHIWRDRCQDGFLDWFRVVVHDQNGHYASTRAFTREELK